MPPPMLRMGSFSAFSINSLVDSFPAEIVIDGHFLSEKPKVPTLLAVPRTPSPNKPFPITPSSTSSSPILTDGSPPRSAPPQDPIDPTPPSPTLHLRILPTRLNHALLDLIESERDYVSDLALIRDIYLPIALGHEPPIPRSSQSLSSSSRILPGASSSTSSISLGPPMTHEDTRIIFGNIADLAELADDFVVRLETALGSVVHNGVGENTVGALFVEKIPRMEPKYMFYITRHPAALARLGSLPQTPALAAFHNTTRALAQQLSPVWDLSSLLIKPVQRLLKYALLLHAIIEVTPNSHGDKDDLRRAKAMIEDVLRAINESQQRREAVKEVFAAGKPAELLKKKGIGIVGRVRGGVGRSITQDDSEEAVQVARMERDIPRIDAFIRQFIEETVEWVKSVPALMSALCLWAEGFGRVIGLGPDVSSEAFDAFFFVVDKQLSAICTELEAIVREQLVPQLSALLETIKRPKLLLETLHALEPHHFASLQHVSSAKGRPPSALNEASTAYVALRAQLCAELPSYLKLLNTGVTLCVRQVARWQAHLWRDVRAWWRDLWDALRVEGEMNAGREETERVWQARWEEATCDLRALSIINPEEITPHPRKVGATMPPRVSMPMPLRRSSSQGRLLEAKLGREDGRRRVNQNIVESHLPSLQRRTAGTGTRRRRRSETHHASQSHPHPPVPPVPQVTISSRWRYAQALYSCRVIHECDPPEGVQYYGLPFFRLSLDDVYHVLKEAGHPKRHRDLPLLLDEGEDCLLLARDSAGELGWILASFLYPVD